MQTTSVAVLFAVLAVFPQIILSQYISGADPNSFAAAAPQYQPYNQDYMGYQDASQYSNGVSGQEAAVYQPYAVEQGMPNFGSFPYSFGNQYGGVPYAASADGNDGSSYQPAAAYPYPYQQQEQ